ncbi:P-loop containing nucleoside triphosphate hydrolase protein [Chytridium lagenaria]|nr:P-loop containing nucleoside triphosphate hydrolase protein [Chytridium lagenaria]
MASVPIVKRFKADDASASSAQAIQPPGTLDEDLVHKKPSDAAASSAAPKQADLTNSVLEQYIASLSASSFLPKPGKNYISEADVGITAFIEPSLKSFTGIIKQRFSDFLVNEVDHTGKIVKLDSLCKGKEAIPEANQEEHLVDGVVPLEVKKKLEPESALVVLGELLDDAETLEKFKNYYKGKAERLWRLCNQDKDRRKAIYDCIKLHFGDIIATDGLPTHSIRVRAPDDVNQRKKNPSRNRKKWDITAGAYLEFVMYKENRDTMEALNHIAKCSGAHAKAFTFAGTKDKRGITVQRVTGHHVLRENIEKLGTSLRGIRFGNFRYTHDRIKLGDLAGNHFKITLRDVNAAGTIDEPVEDLINKSMTALKEKGFINYYGMQRFGTRAVSTHTVGVAMLAERWDVAVELILMPKGDEREDYMKARAHWMANHDPKTAFDLFPKSCTAERAVLNSLIRQKKHKDYFQALLCIPRNLRLMYIHAVQSYVWNHAASERIKRHGYKVVIGDIMAVKGSTADGDDLMDDGEEITAGEARLSRMIEVEVIKTQEQADARSLDDVVLPLPGYSVKYPENDIGAFYKSFMATFGLDPHKMQRKNRENSLAGDYRRVITRPKNVNWKTLRYNDIGVPLTLTDVDELLGNAPIESVEGGSRLALVCEFTLVPSSYATMALREILKVDTSSGFQTELTTVSMGQPGATTPELGQPEPGIGLFGIADRNIVDFMIASAKAAKSDSKLLTTLEAAADLPQTDGARQFVSDLYRKVPRPKASAAKEEERKRKAEDRQWGREIKPPKEKKIKTKKIRQKDADEEWKGEDEGTQVVKRKRKKYDEEEEEELRLAQDKKDIRDEKFSQINEEARIRKQIAEDADLRMNALPNLRELSRQEYLKKREEIKIQLLEQEINDIEYLFSGEKLSKREMRELEFKKTTLRLTKERMQINDKPDGYTMPEDYITEKGKLDKKKLDSILTKRYDSKDDENFVSEQNVWEEYQIHNANMRMTKAQAKTDEMEFDYVFDESEQIQFIQQKTMDVDSDEENDKNQVQMSAAERRAITMKEIRASLPIYEFREGLLEAMQEFQVVIIVGETGSGKTTQIPQYLHEAGYTSGGRKVGCTQPRRVAAICLMIDEAHERTLHTDILFGLVKDIARYRKDLKLLISSATMDAEKFSKYFDDAPIFNIKGRKFPVSVYHTQAPEADYLKAAVQTIMTIHITEPKGDILLFLTGQEEIEAADQTLQLISKQLGSKISEMKICPIYAALPSEKQAEIFEPTPEGVRKVVIATNIAETSITIDGIVYVIDPGFCKQKSFNPKTGMESLVVVPASRAAANQRKGRAGRVQPGKCFRLYTAWAYQNELDENTIPEIQRTNLASVVLMLKVCIDNLMNFDFMDAPPAETLMKAVEQLYALGALNSRGDLTRLGRRMAEFPIDPMLTGNAVFFKPKSEAVQAEQARRNFFRPGGDHISLLSVWNQYVETNFSTAWCKENYIQFRTMKKARDVREQLVGLMERVEVSLVSNPDPANTVPIRKAITAGFFYNTARLQRSGDTYRTTKHNETVIIHPSSSLYISNTNANTNKQYPKWVLYFELVFTTREFMRQVIEIQSDWLLEVAPHYYKPGELEDDSNKKLPKGVGKPASKI